LPQNALDLADGNSKKTCAIWETVMPHFHPGSNASELRHRDLGRHLLLGVTGVSAAS
jgi:hypothetical protein